MTINELVERAHANAKEKGFWDGVDFHAGVGEKIALIHSEASEALECAREDDFESVCHASAVRHWVTQPGFALPDENGVMVEKPAGFPSELADILIRVADLAGRYGFDMDAEVERKMRYNRLRQRKHGKAF